MESSASREARYHVLLVGIDGYRTRPLGGCVNDIDAVQRLLLGRMRLSTDRLRIRRLASPLPGTQHETQLPEQVATLEHLRAALDDLASDRVGAGDRVFIYYSGHGVRVPVDRHGRVFHREALVPVDLADEPGELRLLYDFELNERLRAIVARTRSVALVLDCCHSAGVTRDVDPYELPSRCIDLARDLDRHAPLPDPAGSRAGTDALERTAGVDDCHVVSACLGHQRAREDVGHDGVRHGLLTRAFVDALAACDGDLRAVTWGRIWQAMRAQIERRNPRQQPRMAGNAGRAVFAGPPVDGDPGLSVRRTGEVYRIEAGALASITPGAEVAIYGDRPAYFPRLGSVDDRNARVGVVHVFSADRASALAHAPGAPFDLPPGARGRLVKAGIATRLRCAVVPPDDALAAQLRGSALLELVEPERAQVRLERVAPEDADAPVERGAPERADARTSRDSAARWVVSDDVHGTGRDAPVLFALSATELSRARAVLEHYHAYSQPLRMATLATDLAGLLELRVLRCPGHELGAAAAQEASLPEAAMSRGSYVLESGASVCFRLRNSSPHLLRVTLINAAASGKVQVLGDEIIDPGTFHVFWAHGNLGAPFHMVPPRGSTRCIDRLVAIGTSAVATDLGHLRVDRTFADAVEVTKGGPSSSRDIGGALATAARLERWTAAQVIVVTSQS